MSRTSNSVVAAAVGMLAMPTLAQAQSWPSQPIRIVVPYAAGGVLDVLARLAADHIRLKTGQPAVVENRPGAAGNTALAQLAKTEPDGYTIGALPVSNYQVNPHIYRSMPLDMWRDLVPVAPMAEAPQLLVTPKSLNIKSVAELIAFAKANPEKFNYGSAGTGTPNHVSTAYVLQSLGIAATHVPYRGAAPAVTDMLTGALQMMVVAPLTLAGQIEAGQLVALAAVADKRVPRYPDVATMAEQGFRPYDLAIWYGIVAPAGTRGDIVDRLNRLIVSMPEEPALAQKFKELSLQPMPVTAAEFAVQIKADAPKWAQVIKDAGVKAE